MLLVLSSELSLRGMLAKREWAMTKNQLFRPPAQQDWGASYAQRLEDPILSPGGKGKRREGPKNSVAVVDQCHRTRNGHGRRDSKKQTAKSWFCPPPPSSPSFRFLLESRAKSFGPVRKCGMDDVAETKPFFGRSPLPQQRREEKIFFLGREFGLNGAFLKWVFAIRNNCLLERFWPMMVKCQCPPNMRSSHPSLVSLNAFSCELHSIF